MDNSSHSGSTETAAGDEVVAASQLKLHRVALMGHCCRYRGSRRLFLCNQNHLPMEA